MKRFVPHTLCLALLFAAPVAADPHVDAVTACLADSTNGKDRKLLAKWVFLAMAAHPHIRDLSKAEASDRDQANDEMGKLFTRLVADDCAKPMTAMVQAAGPSSVGTAFKFLGEVAMQELMTHGDVAAVISGFEKHVDQSRITPVIAPAAGGSD